MDVNEQFDRVYDVILAEGGIPGWGGPHMTEEDYADKCVIEFQRNGRGGGFDLVRIEISKGRLWGLDRPLLDRLAKAHLELARINAEAMDQ
jgi:hypothetical protein